MSDHREAGLWWQRAGLGILAGPSARDVAFIMNHGSRSQQSKHDAAHACAGRRYSASRSDIPATYGQRMRSFPPSAGYHLEALLALSAQAEIPRLTGRTPAPALVLLEREVLSGGVAVEIKDLVQCLRFADARPGQPCRRAWLSPMKPDRTPARFLLLLRLRCFGTAANLFAVRANTPTAAGLSARTWRGAEQPVVL
ncbi:hypothetical protein CBM2605_U10014 [Cupriavidus neocaledonicus]|uniref:Uncharacterized protein n=1 Tax=Cupriavidus neocaledonicus TaxID=1040979 RepID=A0ABY1VFA2_9BURK|nr:hypothetical protein CBM2605_U10014 [Cupriavidus neocaledonicus]